jgi:hypothetical protein
MEEVRERSKSDDIMTKIDSGDFIELSGDDVRLSRRHTTVSFCYTKRVTPHHTWVM